MRDFSTTIYREFLTAAVKAGYHFTTFRDYLSRETEFQKIIILRHDVDKSPIRSLRFAKIQHALKIKGTYYFRITPGSLNKTILKKIETYGHEIGYHYETAQSARGNVERAYKEFCRNLEKLRKITTIQTVCMHGSPLSPYDNRKIWEKYDYHQLGIIGEPYFDLDLSKFFYLTDTGRMWDGQDVSVRDKVKREEDIFKVKYHTTQEIINALNEGTFPKMVMMTFHPQRWSDRLVPWYKELIFQGLKNQVKRILVKKNKLSLSSGQK